MGHDIEVVGDIFILLIKTGLEPCEAFIELLALGPKVVLGGQLIVGVEHVILPWLFSVPRHDVKTKSRWLMLVERLYPLISPWKDSIEAILQIETKI
jgi:hypothetical protein